MKKITLWLVTLALLAMPWSVSLGAPLTTELTASGLNKPVFVTAPPDDTTRLFILEQDGRIRVVRNDSLLAMPFLDINSIVNSGSNERGLLGMAFHPNYTANGYFYVNYTKSGIGPNDGATVVARYKVSANPDIAEVDSAWQILSVDQPFSNHNAGMIAFGPNDGYLYIAMGDGGSAEDPGNRGQSRGTLLGKMLRIDIDVPAPATYAIPPDNPFADSATTLSEIWALGLRNPWRFSFDRETSDMYIGDVGQYLWEEIDFQPAASTGGENYGWRLKEGDHCFNPPTDCEDGVTLTDPIKEYSHGSQCSITGGYAYRGCAIPDLQGAYFYADYCSGEIWSLRYNGLMVTDEIDHTDSLGQSGAGISSFGEDAKGEMYIVNRATGDVFKIVPTGPPAVCDLDCCNLRGDANHDTIGPDISDLIFMVLYMFQEGPVPPCLDETDINASGGGPDISDLIDLVEFMFQDGPPPVACS